MTRIHNEYFRTVSLSNRKSCPTCGEKLAGESIWSWGEYVYGKWRTVKHFCRRCYATEVKPLLDAHKKDCGCEFNHIGYSGTTLPDWLQSDCPVH